MMILAIDIGNTIAKYAIMDDKGEMEVGKKPFLKFWKNTLLKIFL